MLLDIGVRVSTLEPFLVVRGLIVSQWNYVHSTSQPHEPYRNDRAYQSSCVIGNKTLDWSDTTCSLFYLRVCTAKRSLITYRGLQLLRTSPKMRNWARE
jgi:hypothetical protein